MAKQKPAFAVTWAWLWQRPVCFVGFGFGTGLVPKAPGTVGTLPAVFIAGLLLGCGMSKLTLGLLCIALCFIGIWICNVTERALGVHDYGGIVWDEIVAMMLIYACVPQGLGWWAVSFAVFQAACCDANGCTRLYVFKQTKDGRITAPYSSLILCFRAICHDRKHY